MFKHLSLSPDNLNSIEGSTCDDEVESDGKAPKPKPYFTILSKGRKNRTKKCKKINNE